MNHLSTTVVIYNIAKYLEPLVALYPSHPHCIGLAVAIEEIF